MKREQILIFIFPEPWSVPDFSTSLILRWRSSANSVAEYLLDDEHVLLSKRTGETYAPVKRSDVHSNYKWWCDNNNLRPVAPKKFTERLQEVSHITGCTVRRKDGIWYVDGLKSSYD